MKKILKWVGIVLGGLLLLIVLAGITMYVVGGSNADRIYEVETAALMVSTDSATVARGAHLVDTNGCRDCHGQELGGQVMVDAPPFRAVAANLTRGKGGIGSRYTAEDFDRTVRHGVKPDGRSVFIMPSAAYHNLCDEDMAALIAYLQQLPPVDNELPKTEFRPLGRLLAAGPLDTASEVNLTPARAGKPAVGPTAEYGAYLAANCAYCHGADLQGVERPPDPGSPPSPSLAAAGRWSLAEFKQTLRTGTTPSGKELDPQFMPWTMTKNMTDVELEALHAYIASQVAPTSASAQVSG